VGFIEVLEVLGVKPVFVKRPNFVGFGISTVFHLVDLCFCLLPMHMRYLQTISGSVGVDPAVSCRILFTAVKVKVKVCEAETSTKALVTCSNSLSRAWSALS